MRVTTYFERLFKHTRKEIYYPSRKNNGIFVTLCFNAAGSNYFTYQKGKKYIAKDVPLQRKIYDGSRSITPEVKETFSPFNTEGLAAFYKESFDSEKLRDIALSFGIPPTDTINEECLYLALAIGFQAFIEASSDDADDIVALEYQKLLAIPKDVKTSPSPLVKVLYPGDRVYLKSKFRPTYSGDIYDTYSHTWEFENSGTQVWRGRKLFFKNHADVRPRTQTNYIDIPETAPHKGVKIAVSMDARGFNGEFVCKWVMVDSEGNECFPNSDTFTFIIKTKLELGVS